MDGVIQQPQLYQLYLRRRGDGRFESIITQYPKRHVMSDHCVVACLPLSRPRVISAVWPRVGKYR